MSIRIVRKDSLQARGKCGECRHWKTDGVAPAFAKRGLLWCRKHVCYTPKDGSCSMFQKKP